MNILITGASGSGTTTLAQYTAEQFAWQWLDTDEFFWLPTTPPFTQRRDATERAQLFLSACQQAPNTVVSGSLYGWGDEIENRFDGIVFLYVATQIRLARLEQRELERYGAINPEFINYAAAYDHNPVEGRSLEKHNQWLAQRTCPVLRLEGDLTVPQRFAALRRLVSSLPVSR